jgi:hypothetical protein
MDPRIDKLVTDLRDADVEARRCALEELSKVEDRKHVVAAIHWTMLNDMDDEIRAFAHEIYIKIGEKEKGILAEPPTKTTAAKEKPAAPEPERRVHIKPVFDRDPNVPGSWSVHFALISIGLIILATLWHIPYMQEKVLFLDVIHYIGLGCSVPGLLLGIIGLRVKDRPSGSALWGIILNAAILLIGIWNILSEVIWSKATVIGQ